MHRQFEVRSGTTLRCKGWRQEALLRLLENVLAVGEDPANLVVYAALGKAARDWPAHDAIVAALLRLEEDQTLIVPVRKADRYPADACPGADRHHGQLQPRRQVGHRGELLPTAGQLCVMVPKIYSCDEIPTPALMLDATIVHETFID